MKTLLRIAAVLSFGFFFLGGVTLFNAARGQDPSMTLAVVLGLSFLGTAFFVGPMLLVAAEKFGRKDRMS